MILQKNVYLQSCETVVQVHVWGWHRVGVGHVARDTWLVFSVWMNAAVCITGPRLAARAHAGTWLRWELILRLEEFLQDFSRFTKLVSVIISPGPGCRSRSRSSRVTQILGPTRRSHLESFKTKQSYSTKVIFNKALTVVM